MLTLPDVTLADLTISPELSQETVAFTATVLLDGQPVGTVSNDGQGSSNLYRYTDRDARARFEQAVAEFAKAQGVRFEAADRLIEQIAEATT